MITIDTAKKKAVDQMDKIGQKMGSVFDDGRYYIFTYSEEADISPIAVDKNSGELIIYFPPEHLEDFMKAVEIKDY